MVYLLIKDDSEDAPNNPPIALFVLLPFVLVYGVLIDRAIVIYHVDKKLKEQGEEGIPNSERPKLLFEFWSFAFV